MIHITYKFTWFPSYTVAVIYSFSHSKKMVHTAVGNYLKEKPDSYGRHSHQLKLSSDALIIRGSISFSRSLFNFLPTTLR